MSEPIFWSCDDGAESLSHTDRDEAIEEHLDSFWPPYKGREADRIADFLAGLPKEMSVFGYVRTKVTENDLDVDAILEASVGRLEEDELGDPDGETWDERMSADQVKAVKDAAQHLIAVIIENYVPWSCEQTVEEKFDPRAWVVEHHPEWLTK